MTFNGDGCFDVFLVTRHARLRCTLRQDSERRSQVNNGSSYPIEVDRCSTRDFLCRARQRCRTAFRTRNSPLQARLTGCGLSRFSWESGILDSLQPCRSTAKNIAVDEDKSVAPIGFTIAAGAATLSTSGKSSTRRSCNETSQTSHLYTRAQR